MHVLCMLLVLVKTKVLSKSTTCSMDGVFLGCNAELASNLPKNKKTKAKANTLHYTLCNRLGFRFSYFR